MKHDDILTKTNSRWNRNNLQENLKIQVVFCKRAFTIFLFTLQWVIQTTQFPKSFEILYKYQDKERCTSYQSNVAVTYTEKKKRAVICSVFRFYHLLSFMNNTTSLGQANIKDTSHV